MTSEVSSELNGQTKTDYWVNRWIKGQTGWHNVDVNRLLAENVEQLIAGRQHIRVLVPLCGKAVELKWFADQGCSVVGIDCSSLAIEQFFKENTLDYEKHLVSEIDGFVYKAVGCTLKIYCCDLFSFKVELEERFNAIWDRGSLVAILPTDRIPYVKLLLSLMADDCRLLFESFEYDDPTATGPPHSIKEATVLELYGDTCNCRQIAEMLDPKIQRSFTTSAERFMNRLWLITLKSL